MASDDHPLEATADDDELEDTAGLEELGPDEIRRMYPGAYEDSITGQWVLREAPADAPRARTPAPNGSRPAVARLRERLYTGNTIQELEPPTWLVDGCFAVPGQSVIYGPPKAGKSFFALEVALSIATGRDAFDRPTMSGPVLYVAAEGVGGLGQRVGAWAQYTGEANLSPIYIHPDPINLGDRHGIGALLELLDELEPVLVVFDTLARCMPGLDENSAVDVGKAITGLDAVRGKSRHVMAVHHSGKDVERGMRGSSALLGAIDTVFELSGDGKAIRCRNTAQRETEPVSDWWLSLEPVMSSAVLVPAAASGRAATVLDALEELPASDRTSSKWLAMAEARGISQRTFYRAKRDALESGAVLVDKDGRGALYTPTELERENAEPDELELDVDA